MWGLPQKKNARRAYKIRLCGHLRRYKKIVKKTYIILLKYLEETLNENRIKKKYVIYSMIAIFVIIAVVVCIIAFRNEPLATISAVISFISAIIVIPTKIVEYLFNPKETEQISEIIKNIQTYDKAVRDDLSKEKDGNN